MEGRISEEGIHEGGCTDCQISDPGAPGVLIAHFAPYKVVEETMLEESVWWHRD